MFSPLGRDTLQTLYVAFGFGQSKDDFHVNRSGSQERGKMERGIYGMLLIPTHSFITLSARDIVKQ